MLSEYVAHPDPIVNVNARLHAAHVKRACIGSPYLMSPFDSADSFWNLMAPVATSMTWTNMKY